MKKKWSGNVTATEAVEANRLHLAELSDVKYASIFQKRTKEHTLLKHAYIYNEFIKVQREMKRMFPEIVSFLPKRYYYLLLSYRFSLTPNYVSALISHIRERGDTLQEDIEKAKIKVANDEYQDYFSRE